jgi:hypothetical protein
MKRINLTSFLHTSARALVVAAVAASSATADLIVRDTFSYADGSLTGKTPEIGGTWTNHSGTAGQTQVVSGQASLVQTQGEDNNTAFDTGAIGAGDVIYSGFDLTVPTQANAPATGYFAHFKDAGNFFGSRVFITTPTTSGYRLASALAAIPRSALPRPGQPTWPSTPPTGLSLRTTTTREPRGCGSTQQMNQARQLRPMKAFPVTSF